MTLDRPTKKGDHIKRIGIIFAGGPAPAANAVIGTTALRFLDDGREVIGFFDGYQHLQEYDAATPLVEGTHYRNLTIREVTTLRSQPGIAIRTSRANPGKTVKKPADLEDASKTAKLACVYRALTDMGVDALVSIGGDDTLKTANFLVEYQKRLPTEARRFHVVHLPKTIDNDYRGIDFTFGYFTAVDQLAREVRNLRNDAHATSSWFIAEVMGRKAGWLSYGVGIAGEANLIFSVEDLDEHTTLWEEVTDPGTGKSVQRKCLNLSGLISRVADLMVQRDRVYHKPFGVVVLAEGLAELLPESFLQNLPRDEHGHISLGALDIGRIVASGAEAEFKKRTGKSRKVKGLQLGYEARCAPPTAFDIVLGCGLGAGAYRALVDHDLTGHMVSLSGQMDIHFVPFAELINPHNLTTEVRFIRPGSDFHRLARNLEDRLLPE